MNQNATPFDRGTDPTRTTSSTQSEVTRVLNRWRRRVSLTYLRDQGTIQLAELVDHLARERANAERRGPTAADEKRSRIELHHTDIPLFADLGLVTYDSTSKTVMPTTTIDCLNREYFITDR